ncbi:MAG TPA: phosphatidate cytidylyltransferase [Xanthobacteraceae bacterium]|nr:phosphatidate cytidylyltransferase [Xanthobacteraceae bacterium]
MSNLDQRGSVSEKLASRFGGTSNLVLRVASAAVLGPLVLVFAYVGGWPFFLLCAAAAAGILWEWTRLVADGADLRILLPGVAALAFALMLAGLGEPAAAAGMIFIGAALAAGVMAASPRRFPARNPLVWGACGIVYAGIAFLGPALLRRDPQWGFAGLLFLAATVWATDIFAYAVGRAIGGPLLLPHISPHKTWAGAVGGVIGGVAAGTSVAYASGVDKLVAVGGVALLLSVFTQAGDLFESAVKRRFGAKDAGSLIPGHGGLMDRLDGFLVAAIVALLIGILRQGPDAPAQGLLVW